MSAWFGEHHVLEDVTLTMPAGRVTALIGPSGCGKSTFLRILNRMHELVPGASLAGEVRLDGDDIYDAARRPLESRRRIGMVFQKANPFPTMSIHDNVVSGLASPAAGPDGAGTPTSSSSRACAAPGSGTRYAAASTPRARRCPAVSSSDSASPARWR